MALAGAGAEDLTNLEDFEAEAHGKQRSRQSLPIHWNMRMHRACAAKIEMRLIPSADWGGGGGGGSSFLSCDGLPRSAYLLVNFLCKNSTRLPILALYSLYRRVSD